MLLLDTNVLSALMRDPPEHGIVAWLDVQPPTDVWTTAINVFELRYGLARLAPGRRRAALEAAFDAMLDRELAGRIAGLDTLSGETAGRLAARREAVGRPVDVRDTLMAGIAVAHRATIATRDVRHFDDAGVPVVDPWSGQRL